MNCGTTLAITGGGGQVGHIGHTVTCSGMYMGGVICRLWAPGLKYLGWVQGALNVLIGLFQKMGLAANAAK